MEHIETDLLCVQGLHKGYWPRIGQGGLRLHYAGLTFCMQQAPQSSL